MNLASLLVRLAPLLLAFPLAASATIYKWTDEHGTTVYSNRAPAAEAKVANVQVALEDDRPAAAPRADSGNALQDRVRALEQQVQALQGQGSGYPAPYPPQLPPATSYYPPPDYYPPPSYPSDYASMYGYGSPYYPYAYPAVIVTSRRFVRPVHGFVGQRFGPRPMPVTRAVGGVRAMGVAHRR
jgi:hypothetical protein